MTRLRRSSPTGPPRLDPGRRVARGRLARTDRGSVSAELVIAMPLLMLMILLIAQFALWAHATHIAQAAAAQGLAAARVSDGTTATGTAAAEHLLTRLGHGPLRDPHVAVTRTAEQASVRITGAATAVVPFLYLRVHGEATGPVETYRSALVGPAKPGSTPESAPGLARSATPVSATTQTGGTE